MLPKNIPHWVISLTLPLTGLPLVSCTSDQEAGEMKEFDEGGDESMSQGEDEMAPAKKNKKKMKKKTKKKKKKKVKSMKKMKKMKKKTKKKTAPSDDMDAMDE